MWDTYRNHQAVLLNKKTLTQQEVQALQEGEIVYALWPLADYPQPYRIRHRHYPDRQCVYLTDVGYQEAPCYYRNEISGTNPANQIGRDVHHLKLWKETEPEQLQLNQLTEEPEIFRTIRWSD